MSVATGNPVFETVGGDASAATVTPTGRTTAGSLADLAAQVVTNTTDAGTAKANAASALNTANSAAAQATEALSQASQAITSSSANIAGGYAALDGSGNANVPGNMAVGASNSGARSFSIGHTGLKDWIRFQFYTGTGVAANPDFVFIGMNGTGNTDGTCALQGTAFQPLSSNTMTLGSSNNAWSGITSQTAVDVISDLNDKNIIGTLGNATYADVTAKLRVVWASISGVVYTLKSGQSGRQHIGVIAQYVAAAFKAEGLDAADFGVWCSTPKKQIVTKAVDGQKIMSIEPVYETDGKTQETQETIRYAELLSLGLFCEKLERADLEARVAALESKSTSSTAA